MSDEPAAGVAVSAEEPVAAAPVPPSPAAEPEQHLAQAVATFVPPPEHDLPPPISDPPALPMPELPAAADEHPAETIAEESSHTEPERDPEPAEFAAEPSEPSAAAEPTAPVKKKRAKAKPADEEPAAVSDAPLPTIDDAPPAAPESTRKWYVVKVQSGREDSIKRDIERKVIIQGLEECFGRIEIPVEEVVEKKKVKAKVKDKKTGEMDTVYQEKNITKKRKKFPGYLFAEVDFNDRILYLFRETSGVGDFVGATQHRAPNPMSEHEVQSMLTGIAVKGGPKAGKVKVKLDYEKGDKVKIREGAFSGMEGEVKHISEAKDASETPKVKVEVTIFGRPVEVELDYWQVDKA